MAYFVLAGGYPNVVGKFGGTRKIMEAQDNIVDYVIKIDNLPKEFFKPEGITYHRTYHCKKCDRPVPEGEMEGKFGCFFHDVETNSEKVDIWNDSSFHSYKVPKVKWMTPAYRVWVNNPGGIEKWQGILRYIEQKLPPNQSIPNPLPVGTKTKWEIEEETIDNQAYIKLPEVKEEKKECKCEYCDKLFDNEQKLRGHMLGSHKGIKNETAA